MTGHLDLWTVYDHPADHPLIWVARRSEVHGQGQIIVTADLIKGLTLKEVRQQLIARGLVCMTRHPEDDAVIAEVWL